MSLATLVARPKSRKPLITIFGDAGMGKTTLASTFPNPLFILAEDGLMSVEKSGFPPALPLLQSSSDLWSQLTMVIKEVSGKSAKDWIVEYIVLEIKALLKNTNMNIQEIAVKTNFANQSSLGRFFRKHTGMSLSQYRMSNLG